MRRTTMKALAVATGLLLTATGCGGGGEKPATSADGKSVLTITLWNYASTPEFKALIEGFEAEHPNIDIQPVDILADDYPDKLTTMLAGGDQTDVLTMKNVISYARYANRGQLASLTDEVKAVNKKSYLGLDAFDIKGEYFAMPYRQDFWALYYNKSLLKDAGADLSNLTWQDYATLAKSTSKGEGTTKVYGAYQHTWRSVVQAIAAAQTGGDQLGGDYAFMADQYKLTLDLEKSGAMMPYASAKNQKVSYNTMFSTGKAAMLPMGTWYAGQLIADTAAGKTKVDWGLAPLPQVTKDGKITTFGSPTAFAINKKAKNPAAAKKFIAWASGEKGATTIAKLGVYPSFNNDAVLSAYGSIQGMPTDEIAKKAFKPDTVKLEMPVSEKSSDVDKILNEEHQLIMVGDKTVDAGLAAMKSRVKSEVS